MTSTRTDPTGEHPPSRFPPALLYRAARLYYLENATQAEVAEALGTSRPTVSRLLSEARASGIVHIEVREPGLAPTDELADRLCTVLGLKAAHVTASAAGAQLGSILGPGVAEALRGADLQAGDALLVSSGASVYAAAQQPLPALPGVILCPTVGGVDEHEAYYQTNELTRSLAVRLHGTPVPLYAPAMPSQALRDVLMEDPLIRRVTTLWKTAKAGLLGIGAPPPLRSSLPSVLPPDAPGMSAAVGDISVRPFDGLGEPVTFPGSERLVAIELADLRRLPHSIGLAVGAEKVPAILAATRAGYVNTLVTDLPTARLLIGSERQSASTAH